MNTNPIDLEPGLGGFTCVQRLIQYPALAGHISHIGLYSPVLLFTPTLGTVTSCLVVPMGLSSSTRRPSAFKWAVKMLVAGICVIATTEFDNAAWGCIRPLTSYLFWHRYIRHAIDGLWFFTQSTRYGVKIAILSLRGRSESGCSTSPVQSNAWVQHR